MELKFGEEAIVKAHRLEQVDADIVELERRIDEKLVSYEEQRQRLTQIPGLNTVLAAVVIAEIGMDMTVFKSADRLASWARHLSGQ